MLNEAQRYTTCRRRGVPGDGGGGRPTFGAVSPHFHWTLTRSPVGNKRFQLNLITATGGRGAKGFAESSSATLASEAVSSGRWYSGHCFLCGFWFFSFHCCLDFLRFFLSAHLARGERKAKSERAREEGGSGLKATV